MAKIKVIYNKYKGNKKVVTIFTCLMVFVFMGIFAIASTVISDTGISSPVVNVTQNIQSQGNITVESDGLICFDGPSCNVYQTYNGSALITKVN